MISPPPIDEYKLDAGFMPGSRKAVVTRQYAQACSEVAGEENVEFLDLWTEAMDFIGWDLSQPGIPGSKDLPPNTWTLNHRS